jgi:protein TonB
VSITAEPPLPPPAYPWRRGLIALWASVTAHLLLLSFIHLAPRPPHPQAETLQVRLDTPEPNEIPVPILQSKVSSVPLEKPLPLPQTQMRGAAPGTEPPPGPEQSSAPQLDLPQLADTHYYDALALDVQPQPIGNIEPMDPEAGISNPHVGYVRMELKLEADGQVSEVKVLDTNLPPAYEKAAIDAFSTAKFAPGQRNGRAVRAQIKIELKFKLPPATRSM